RRSGPATADRLEPDVERDQVHTKRRAGGREAVEGRSARSNHHLGHGQGHRASTTVLHFQSISAGRRGRNPSNGRAWAWTVACARPRGIARRLGVRRERRPGQGSYIHREPAAESGETGSARTRYVSVAASPRGWAERAQRRKGTGSG